VAIGKTPPRKETEWFSDKEGVKGFQLKILAIPAHMFLKLLNILPKKLLKSLMLN